MYAIIQYSPSPERLEFINVGIVLIVQNERHLGIKFSKNPARIERLFGRQPKIYLDAIKEGFASRLKYDWQQNPELKFLETFALKRANGLRLSPLMPVAVDDAENVLNSLFSELVGDEQPPHREPRIRRKLRECFVERGVEHYLQDPAPVELPEYGIKVDVPFGYQNGCYNLIDGMRLSSAPSDSLREAGKRAMEGALIWKHYQAAQNRKRLVIVGDFAKQSSEFYNAVKIQMNESNVKLYRLDEIEPLVDDIRENAAFHDS
ncbi:DUF3037 domain-containing protein [Devosia sp. FJ2-5-3]|uniref:DUF3037 domain-containing protein n=1 Tax=Devosia sp. FJ2-5-3 TaxID=2976680 RepID=UPI0023D82EE7|nr:DUF3037 domain-containing protein [Devosia sp. FJ2-5-3]WEJ57878.1 DUF3037 domain-containing protein [Devosia sp. FJ2-5-3]